MGDDMRQGLTPPVQGALDIWEWCRTEYGAEPLHEIERRAREAAATSQWIWAAALALCAHERTANG